VTNLDDALTALYQMPSATYKCSVALWLESLDESDKQKITKVVDDPLVPASRVSNLLSEFGCPKSQNLRRHRRRMSSPSEGCRCPV